MSMHEDTFTRSSSGSRGRKGKSKVPASKPFYSFHPTKEEAEKLNNDQNLDLAWALDVIEARLEGDIRFSITYKAETGSKCVVARDGGLEWNEGTALSVFHSSLERALIGMAYMLHYKCPGWPEEPYMLQTTFNW